MNRRIVWGILLALVLIAGAVSLGVSAYNLAVTGRSLGPLCSAHQKPMGRPCSSVTY